jgi:AraC-like DNA-binding protein
MKKYERSGLKESKALNILKVLIDYMEENKLYLKNNLTIYALSKEIDIPKHYISQVINENLNKNFNTFINEYRVKEFKQRLIDPANANFTIMAIAFESGFNSKSSFNMIFKKKEKTTPSEFRKSILDKKSAKLNKIFS